MAQLVISELFIYSLLVALMVFMSVEDTRFGQLSNRALLLLMPLLFMLYPFYWESFLITAGFIVLLIKAENWYKKECWGGGDIKLLLVLALFIPLTHIGYFYMLAGLGALVEHLLLRRQSIPLVPFLCGAFLMVVK